MLKNNYALTEVSAADLDAIEGGLDKSDVVLGGAALLLGGVCGLGLYLLFRPTPAY
jgi:hypothetical protein